MSSFSAKRHSESNITTVNESQNSEDLFGESQLSFNTFTSPLSINNSPQENSSETSEELSLIHRKPRKALNFSDSSYYSKKSCESLRNGLNTCPSNFFRPISTEFSDVSANSSDIPENDHQKNSDLFKNTEHHLSRDNAEVISFISESKDSDSSSILDNSLNCETPTSKKVFKTPVYSSVKKHIIRQWLSNVSLHCPLKPEANETDLHSTEQHSSEEQNSLNILKNNNCTSLSTNDVECNKTFNIGELEVLNGVKDKNNVENQHEKIEHRSSLTKDFEKCSNEYSPQRLGTFGNHYSFHESNDEPRNGNDSFNIRSVNFSNKNPQPKLSHSLEKSCHDKFLVKSDCITSIKDRPSIRFNRTSICFKSDDESSSNECYSTFDEVGQKDKLQEVDFDDDSFIEIRSTKKKRNCLNISSDDSEAKDTANDSEDTPLYTPRKRLYFRNPLNNSLDDDAKPLVYDKSESKITKSVGKKINKNKSLLDQICSDVLDINISITTISPIKNPEVPFEFEEICNDNDAAGPSSATQIKSSVEVGNKQFIVRKCSISDESQNSIPYHEFTEINRDIDLSSAGKEVDKSAPKALKKSSIIYVHDSPCNESTGLDNSSVKHIKRRSKGDILNCSTDEQLNVNQSNIFSLSEVIENDSQVNSSHEENKTLPVFNKSCISNDHESSTKLPNELDESSDSILIIKRKSRIKNTSLNISSDDSFYRSKSHSDEIPKDFSANDIDSNNPICNLSPKMKSLKNLIQSDNEYDKYIYRSRSDSSSSDSEGFIDNAKDSLTEVNTLHTTTSDEEDDDNTPWVDLESYLKKNVPASTKSFESSFLKNINKRKAILANISLPSHSSCPDHTSFLLSLTPEVSEEMCHPDAVKYRGKHFSKNKFELVDVLFKLYNKEIFDDKLPALEIKWSGHLTTTSGITKSSSKITKNGKIRSSMIKLSKTVVNDASKLRDVLLHELCHAANWLIDEQAAGHGPLFKKWVNKIWMKYPEVPKVKTTHRYELKWKYLYKCTYCGYELGKMKLSLDENKCRLCGGSVTVNT